MIKTFKFDRIDTWNDLAIESVQLTGVTDGMTE